MNFKKHWKFLTGLFTATGVCLAIGVCAIAGVFATDTTQTGTKNLGDGTAIEETISTKDTNVTLTVITDIGEGKMKAHYSIPSGSTVTINGNVLTVAGKTITAAPAQSGYQTTWSIATGTAITADTTVTATCSLAAYSVQYIEDATTFGVLSGFLTYTGALTATNGVDYSSRLSSSSPYSSPYSVSITIGGNNYTGYSYSNYTITIPGADITGNIVIEVTMSACFVAGTQVWAYDIINKCDVYKNIEDVAVGDYVYTFNEETGGNELGEVTALKRNKTKYNVCKLVAVNEGTNETFEVTGTLTHPIYSLTYGDYIALGDLEVGETLKLANGTAKVVSVTLQSEQEYVYNFTVKGNHNYYITENNLLVHNMPDVC